jgi:hypothetical protein
MNDRTPAHLTDDVIERMLHARAGVGAPPDLTGSIVELAAATRQRGRPWLAVPYVRDGARGRVLLAAALLAIALVGAAFAVGSSLLRRVDLSVAPSPPPVLEPTVPPSPPPDDPTPSPVPSTSPSAAPVACASAPPTDQPRVTTIDLPAKAYLRVAFAGCSVWIGNNQNGIGIHRVDVGANEVVDTVLEGPIERPVTIVRSDRDELWALEWDDPGQLLRLDPATGTPITSIQIPSAELDGGVWIMHGYAWLGPGRLRPNGDALTVIDLDTRQVVATLPDVVPFELWQDSASVWAVAQRGDGMELVRIDATTFAVSRKALPWEGLDVGSPTIADDRLFVAGPGQILEVSTGGDGVLRQIPLERADRGVLLASSGTALWAVPMESMPLTRGHDNQSLEVVQVEPATGSIAQRIPIREIGVMEVHYAYGSLWILAPDDDYLQTFGMHLVRVELPAGL